MSTPMKGLSNDELATLLGKTRTKNMYGPKLLEFVASDEAAINPRDCWPVEFGNAKVENLYQGFNNAKKTAKLENVVEVRRSEDNIFILHTERVNLSIQAQMDEATASEADEQVEA